MVFFGKEAASQGNRNAQPGEEVTARKDAQRDLRNSVATGADPYFKKHVITDQALECLRPVAQVGIIGVEQFAETNAGRCGVYRDDAVRIGHR